MKSILEKLENQTIKLSITIPFVEVKKIKEEVILEAVKNAELPGFRKGKAPGKLVEEKLDQAKIKEDVLKKLLPKAYLEAVKEHNLRPIINPRVHVEKLEDDKDWQFHALTCEEPKVTLGDYKENIKKITAKAKIIIPGKEPEAPKFEEITQALLTSVKAEIPGILIEQEVEKLLSQTLDEIKRLGLTLDQYLQSTNKTPEKLKEEYAKKAGSDIMLEFVLQKIAEEEKITVEQKEIEEAILKAQNDTERKNLEANRYLLAAILRQQKTLDFLKNL